MGRLCSTCAILLLATHTVCGEIVSIQARVQTSVQELLDGAPGSVNSDLVESPEELPLIALAELHTTDVEAARESIGQGFSVFEDPTRVSDPNPQEFALETACYSNAPRVSYVVESRATEDRTVRFNRRELGLSPFRAGREVTSRAFLSGAVIFWSDKPITPARPLSAEIAFTMTSDAGADPLFETGLTMDGTDEVEATGPIVFERVGLDELADLGIDEATIAILQRLEDEGELVILVLPSQEHEYVYEATVDEPIVLTATINADVRNAPDGTGVAATLGRPFEELADFIEQALPGVDGESVERSLNKAIANRDVGLVPSPAAPAASPPRLCGAMGSVALLAFLAFFLRNRFV